MISLKQIDSYTSKIEDVKLGKLVTELLVIITLNGNIPKVHFIPPLKKFSFD